MRWRKRRLYWDSLTGGYNREGFFKEGQELLKKNRYRDYAVVYYNIKNFGRINGCWGEEEGNQTLRYVYQKLEGMIRTGEMVSRSNMDHFFLLLWEPEDAVVSARAEAVVKQINDEISKKYYGYQLDFSIGAYRAVKPEALCDMMNKAIQGSRSGACNFCHFCDKETADWMVRNRKWNLLFEDALKKGEFQIYLQPKVPLDLESSCQAEALVRWVRPGGEIVYPGEFIHLFEENGKICELDIYVFEQVCRLLKRWINEGQEVSKISVNISRYHLKQIGMDVWKRYQKLKEAYGIPDGVIEIELTETVLMEEEQIAFIKTVMERFKESGFLTALDDFGFGYSSLALLKEFEVGTLKLDRTFFVNENRKSRIIISHIIQMAHSLQMNIVAEGIEEEGQIDALRDMRCDMVQGYIYSKALPIKEFEAWRESWWKSREKFTEKDGEAIKDMLTGEHAGKYQDIVSDAYKKFVKVVDKGVLPMGIYEHSKISGKTFANDSLYGILGFKRKEEEAEAFRELEAKLAQIEQQSVVPEENIYRCTRNGNDIFVRMQKITDDQSVSYYISDVSSWWNEIQYLKEQNNRDSMTGLLNRRGFLTRMETLFADGKKLGCAGLVMIDADGLKEINDLYGHHAGDEYLCQISTILMSFTEKNKVCARIGGDEFAVFLYGCQSDEETEEHFGKLLAKRGRTWQNFQLDEKRFVEFSVGYAFYPAEGEDYYALMHLADKRMYQEKKQRKGSGNS